MSISPFGTEKNFGITDSLLDAVRGVVRDNKEEEQLEVVVETEELEEKKLDPVGQEDDDVDNDGDTDSSDEYLKKRRKAIGKAMKGKKDDVDTDPKLDEENIDEAMRVLATKGKTKVVTKGDGVAKVMVGGKEVASGDLDDGAGGWFMSRKGEKGQKFFDSPKKIADFYAEEAIMERKDDTATMVAKALKKMGVKPNAKEADVIKKIPDVLKKMGMQQALNMMNRDKDYRNDMLGDILDSLSGMKEGLEDNTSNPANSQHLCAKQVVHEEWGTGNPINGMHAEPDADGQIAWYDVMFDHGIEREVSIDEMKVIKSAMHGNHKKKK